MTETEQLAISYIDGVCKYLDSNSSEEDYLRQVEGFMYYMDAADRRYTYRAKLMGDIGQKALKGVSARDKPLDIQDELSRAIFKYACSKFNTEKFPMRVLSWNGSTVLKIAKNIYEGDNYKDSGILGDALEDAGFENSAIIAHLQEGEFSKFHKRECLIIQNLFKLSEFIDL